jgi:hypothetical protein
VEVKTIEGKCNHEDIPSQMGSEMESMDVAESESSQTTLAFKAETFSTIFAIFFFRNLSTMKSIPILIHILRTNILVFLEKRGLKILYRVLIDYWTVAK